MKQRLLSAIAGIVLAFGVVAFTDADSMHMPPIDQKDSVVVSASGGSQPIFSGDETTKADSLAAVADVITDTTLKNLIEKTALEIKDKPEAGAPWTAYIAYVFSILAAIYGVVSYFRKRWNAKKK